MLTLKLPGYWGCPLRQLQLQGQVQEDEVCRNIS